IASLGSCPGGTSVVSFLYQLMTAFRCARTVSWSPARVCACAHSTRPSTRITETAGTSSQRRNLARLGSVMKGVGVRITRFYRRLPDPHEYGIHPKVL